jgi:hypothetical protein
MRSGLQRLLFTVAALAGAGFAAHVQESPREVVEYTCSSSYSIVALKTEQSVASGHRYAVGSHIIKAVCCSVSAIVQVSGKLSASAASLPALLSSIEEFRSYRSSLFHARAPPPA